MQNKRMRDGDHKFMSTNGALASHSIWNDAIKSTIQDPITSKSALLEGQDIHQLVQREFKAAAESTQLQQPRLGVTGCRKCGHLGHLTNQCMNVLRGKDGRDEVVGAIGKVEISEEDLREIEKSERLIEKLKKVIEKKKKRKRDKKKAKKREGKKAKKAEKKKEKGSNSSSSSSGYSSESSSSDEDKKKKKTK